MNNRLLVLVLSAWIPTCLACSNDNSPQMPTSSPVSGPTTISFSGLTNLPCQGLFPSSSNCAVSLYTESGFSVSAIAGDWIVRTDYGNPGPFVEFVAAAGATVTGEVRITSLTPFVFTSVDLYSSTATIPYQLTGLRNGTSVFAVSATMPNTFGDFRTVTNPTPAAVIDTLSVVLTNAAAQCCRNPTGLDNIVLSR
jgi:hypothetical protein